MKTTKEELEFLGNIKTKISSEGLGYYITDYESPFTFNEYPELKSLFIDAVDALDAFTNYLDVRITELGGDPDDFEA